MTRNTEIEDNYVCQQNKHKDLSFDAQHTHNSQRGGKMSTIPNHKSSMRDSESTNE